MALPLPLAAAAAGTLLAASLLAAPPEPVAVPHPVAYHAVALQAVVSTDELAVPDGPPRAAQAAAVAALHPVDAALQILPALAWAVVATPIAVVLFPLWAAQGFPTASATDPSRPDSGCGGPGLVAQCALRALLYYLVPAPYELLATRVADFVGSLRPAPAAAAAARVAVSRTAAIPEASVPGRLGQARPGVRTAPGTRSARTAQPARPQTRSAKAAAARPAERAAAEPRSARRVGPRA